MVSLTQLGIANQQLNTTVILLSQRQNPRIIIAAAAQETAASASSNFGLERKQPPGYEESQMIAAIRQRNLRKRASAASALGVAAAAAAPAPAMGNSNQLHTSPSTQSLPVELAGDTVIGSRAENVLDIDFDKLSITSSLLDGLCDGSQYVRRDSSSTTTSGLGRARSRRWMEAHYG